ncbi:hypothetical protein Enr17x_49910 [Gimesia fumaroli]|uniref:Uncharacterized protein n=1 Tax=Gimesia fumaroli TaxID=2527976 RepID=A0A518IIL7_9PLAN|nr:hypothetical protein Enr17x_49910 [Gimesia fumaroli]
MSTRFLDRIKRKGVALSNSAVPGYSCQVVHCDVTGILGVFKLFQSHNTIKPRC